MYAGEELNGKRWVSNSQAKGEETALGRFAFPLTAKELQPSRKEKWGGKKAKSRSRENCWGKVKQNLIKKRVPVKKLRGGRGSVAPLGANPKKKKTQLKQKELGSTIGGRAKTSDPKKTYEEGPNRREGGGGLGPS